MKIVQIGFANFRSIGSEPVILDLRKRINLLIGANNSGKSNVLRILQRIQKQPFEKFSLTPEDLHDRDGSLNLEVILDVVATEQKELPDGISRFHVGINRGVSEWKQTPFDQLNYLQTEPFKITWRNSRWNIVPNDERLREEVEQISVRCLNDLYGELAELHLIPEFREIRDGDYEIKGSGVAQLLGEWKSPEFGKDGDKLRFRKVEDFLRQLLDMPEISLDVSRESTKLMVERGDLRLPLTNYGTGIHQLIILAIAVLAHENALIGIEEPEIHLHPLLQKAFLKFLVEKTTNRYVITTHSNAFLSQPADSHITHLWLDDGETKSRAVETTEHILEVLSDLGVRAADIMQANFVIWVEGPSDRIYLNHWLKLVAPELTEGLDYAIMFYGGRLLSHLSMDREDDELSTEELIKLLRINQHAAILIDSDKASAGAKVNATKQRIFDECGVCEILCWITKGREIENYLEPEAISKAYAQITSKTKEIALEPFQKINDVVKAAYNAEWKPKFAYEGNKPGFARRIMEQTTSLPDRLDLRKRMAELVKAIRDAK